MDRQPHISPQRRKPLAVALVVMLSGCAGDFVRTDGTPQPKDAYAADLDGCRTNATAAGASDGAGGMLALAFLGAAEGAGAGAIQGGPGIGAAIGAGAGAVIGFVGGVAGSKGPSIEDCMRGRGYKPA